MRVRFTVLFILLFFYTSLFNYSLALTADNSAPVVVTADTFEIDYKNHYAAYSNNVELNQGSKKLTSDKLQIYFVNNKIKSVVATSIQSGLTELKELKEKQNHRLVNYFEKIDNMAKQESTMQARAKKITYDPNINKIILEQSATIKQGDKELNSELINYDMKKQVAHMPKIQNRRTKITIG